MSDEVLNENEEQVEEPIESTEPVESEEERLQREEQERLQREQEERERAEEARLRAIQEHMEYLNSFPETTIFYERILETDTYKVLAGTTKNPYTAELNKCLDNHMDTSELSVVLENGVEKYYLKGYEKPEPSEIEKMKAYAKMIELQVDRHLQELCDSKGYDDVKSCVGYFNSTDETFQREARAMTVYRDHLYRTCYNIMDQCEKGEIDYRVVTLEYILSLVDPIDW